jgi:DNA-binding transcriptional LysR family regulator
MIPTARALQLESPLRAALGAVAQAIRKPDPFDPTTARRAFHIGTGDYAEMVLLPRLAARLARAPGIELWIHQFSDDGNAQLVNGAFDVVIAPPLGATRPAGCYERTLFTESFTCVMRADHPLAADRLTLARYCDARHVLVAPRGTPGSVVDSALASTGQSRHIAVAVPHFLIVPHVIAASDLIATLASRIVASFAPTHGLVQKPPPLDIPGFAIALAWHERTHVDPGLKWLRDQLSEIAAETPTAGAPPARITSVVPAAGSSRGRRRSPRRMTDR